MTVEQAIGKPLDPFPVGMRVLAVDDNPTCLHILERLLRQCRYHVTITNEAIKALKLLRENKNKFDLVISDVEMPDMDGFKLLEFVGLEMDLPVIMLSGHSDPKFVMKGITHGACDYLLKPVRIEELKNIWQHVIRRRKFENKKLGDNSKNKEGPQSISGNSEAAWMGNSDQNGGKASKKRKEQNEDEEEENDENEDENEDHATQKKPRVVWSMDLHRKFVEVVNQLGIDKAVPKKILDLMNVEKLTRENVASHLQKYRLYLKRISCVTDQQASLAAVLGTTDPHYLPIGSSLNGLGNFHRSMPTGSGQFHGLRSVPPNGILGRLNSLPGHGVGSRFSSGLYLQNTTDPGKFQQVSVTSNNCNGRNILQGLPMPLQLDQLQCNNIKRIPENPTLFPDRNLPDCVPTSLLVLEGHPQQASPMGTSLNSGSSSHFPGDQNNGRLDNPSGAVSSTLHPIAMVSQNGNHNNSNQFDVTSLSSPGPNCVQLLNSKRDATQEWDVHNSLMNYPSPFGCDNQNVRILSRNTDFGPNRQSGFLDSWGMKESHIIAVPTTDASLDSAKEGYLLRQQKPHSLFTGNDDGSLDDIVNSMVKKEQNQTDVTADDLGFNSFGSLRISCI